MSSRFAVSCVAIAALAGCGKKKSSGPSPEVTGLAAVPASAEVVIAIDVPRVIDAPLVAHAVEVLLNRDSVLADRWQKLHDTCKVDVKQFSHVVLAIGPHSGPQPGTGPVLVVATGKLVETELAACVRGMVGQGSGGLTATPLGDRTLYRASDAGRAMYFAFGRPDTLLMSASEELITEALGTGKKITDNPDMQKWFAMADQKAPIWAAGRVDDRVRQGMVKTMNGTITAGPSAMVVAVDFAKGVKLEAGAVMASPADAKALESYAKTQLAGLGMAAQARGMGKLVDAIQVAADGSLVRFIAAFDSDQVNQLVSVLDGGGGSAQSPPPPSGSAGSAGP